MKFIPERYAFAADDGRIVLRATVDRPVTLDCGGFEYLNAYSAAISEFVLSVLLVKAMDAYDQSRRLSTRFFPLSYLYNCVVTYFDGYYLSCALTANLSQGTNLISRSFDTIVFAGDQIIPPKQICHVHGKRKFLLDADGFPSVAEIIDGSLQLRKVGKKSLIKQ